MIDPQLVQRVLVRMHYDPSLARAITSGQAVSGVPANVLALLQNLDGRAFQTDPLRPVRALQALLAEFPVACALVPLAKLRDFFTASFFREAIMQRQSLSAAFANYLQTQRVARPFAQLEAMVARVRRRPSPTLTKGQVVVATKVGTVQVRQGCLAGYQAVRARLGEDPVRAIIEGQTLSAPALASGHEWIYLAQGALGRGSQPLHQLLQACEAPLDWTHACEAAVQAGATVDEAPELLRDLVAEGLLLQST